MGNPLRYHISDAKLTYAGRHEPVEMGKEKVSTFNQRHKEVLGFYGLELADGRVFIIDDHVNEQSNLGVFRSKQLRQAVILAAALPAAAVAIHGFGALNAVPKERQDKALVNRLKRRNDRLAAQIMSEVLQITTDTFDLGEEVIIESNKCPPP